MNYTGRKRHIKTGAWTISVCLHLIAIVIFSRMVLSQSTKSIVIPRRVEAKISRIKEIIDNPPVTPLPKINALARKKGSFEPEVATNLTTFEPKPAANPETLATLASAGSAAALPSKSIGSSVEFFGSRSYNRKICYVVDASGSMQGFFGNVRENLKQSIQNLQPDQFFHIIFFTSKTLIRFEGSRLIRARASTKAAAYRFIDTVTPAGTTNALDALAGAMRLRDSFGKSPEIIYFLTDGFELTTRQSSRFLDKLLELRNNLAPRIKINTIGFWTQPEDYELLSKIARRTGGTFTRIRTQGNE
ncbi:MAG: VWA domain-containing protein [Planctomycetes bacterium]|nr:VWA domain-containing protein [Planctomycetota bacterium]